MKLVIGGKEYKSKKDAENYYWSIINQIGVCDNVSLHKEAYDDFMELIKRLPDGDRKTHDTINFKIVQDYLNKSAYT